MDEKKPQGVQELKDEQLGDVTGGGLFEYEGSKYLFVGGLADINEALNCPKCGRTLSFKDNVGKDDYWRCTSCRCTYHSSQAVPNFASGLWMKIG